MPKRSVQSLRPCRRCGDALPIPGRFLCADCFGKCTSCGGQAVKMPSGYYRAFCSACRMAAEVLTNCSKCGRLRDGSHATYCRECYREYDRTRSKGRCVTCGGRMNVTRAGSQICRRCYVTDTPASAKEKGRLRWLKKAYGLTPAEWDAIFASQNKACAVCGATEAAVNGVFAVDHCHTTMKIRGILCNPCNLAIGAAKDDPVRLRALADYVERHASSGASHETG